MSVVGASIAAWANTSIEASPGAVSAVVAAGTNTSTEGSAKASIEVFASLETGSRLRGGRLDLGTSTCWKFSSGQLLGECGGVWTSASTSMGATADSIWLGVNNGAKANFTRPLGLKRSNLSCNCPMFFCKSSTRMSEIKLGASDEKPEKSMPWRLIWKPLAPIFWTFDNTAAAGTFCTLASMPASSMTSCRIFSVALSETCATSFLSSKEALTCCMFSCMVRETISLKPWCVSWLCQSPWLAASLTSLFPCAALLCFWVRFMPKLSSLAFLRVLFLVCKDLISSSEPKGLKFLISRGA